MPEKTPNKNLPLIPLPAKIELKDDVFRFKPDTLVTFYGKAGKNAEDFALALKETIGLQLKVLPEEDAHGGKNTIMFRIAPDTDRLGQEGYRLRVLKNRIIVDAGSPAGAFYVAQTIYQLLSYKKTGPCELPQILIEDEPRYEWRGMMLDSCRHFFDKESVKKFIDLMARYKLNRFHWHLTEDQAWRLEIKKYPQLTEKAAFRREQDGTEHGGFYSQEDVKEIIDYAHERFISVIPEIEIPGHATSALSVFPELSCNGHKHTLTDKWGVYKDVYCAGKEKVFEFLEDIFTEVCDLFDDDYVHIGCDECPKDNWRECVRCQSRIKNSNLEDEKALQTYFATRISRFIQQKGKKVLAWDEILEGGAPPDVHVMAWRKSAEGVKGAQQGHNVVMCPKTHCYFDYSQEEDRDMTDDKKSKLKLRKTYSFDPIPKELTPSERERIIGTQGTLWTEHINTPARLEYMAVPRMCALAEVAWSPASARNWQSFKTRMAAHGSLLDKLGVNYYRNCIIWRKKK